MLKNYSFVEIVEFWRFRWKRGGILLLAVAFVAASLGIVISARQAARHMLPQGATSHATWLTLGARSKAGTFSRVSLQDIKRYGANESVGRLYLYAPMATDLRYGSFALKNIDVGLVSGGLFEALHVPLYAGVYPSAAKPGVLVSKKFFDKYMPRTPLDSRQRIAIGSVVLPIVGVIDSAFEGFGGVPPSIYVNESLLSQVVDLSLPIPENQVEDAKNQLLPQLAFFYGFLRLNSPNDEVFARRKWNVTSTEFVGINLPPRGASGALKMKLGFSTLGQKPEAVTGVTLDPERALSIQAMTFVFALLAIAAIGLALLDILSFWLGESSRRQGELKTRIAVGATTIKLISLFQLEALPFILMYVVFFLLFRVLMMGRLLSDVVGASGINQDIVRGASLPVAVSVGLVLFLAGSLSALSFARRGVAARGVGGTKNMVRLRYLMRIVGWFGLVSGCFIVDGSLLATYKLGHFQWGGSQNPFIVEASRASSVDQFLRQRPWITSGAVATANTLPLANLGNRYSFYVLKSGRDRTSPLAINQVSPTFFSVSGVHLIAGSNLSDGDQQGVMLSLAATKALGLKASDAIGMILTQKVDDTGDHDFHFRIVGVVSDIRYDSLAGAFEPVVYELSSPGGSNSVILLPGDTRLALHKEGISSADVSVRRLSDVANSRTSSARRLLIISAAFSSALLIVMVIGVLSDIDMIRRDSLREMALRAALGAGIFRATLPTMIGYGSCVLIGGGFGVICIATLGHKLERLSSGISAGYIGLGITVALVVASMALIWARLAGDLMVGSLLDKLKNEDQ